MPAFNRLLVFLSMLVASSSFAKQGITVTSPDKKIVSVVDKDQSGLIYRVSYKGQLLVDKSRLSISFKEGGTFGKDITMGKPVFKKMEETYDLIIGKSGKVHSVNN